MQHVAVCVVERRSHLDHSEQALVRGGVSGDGEASGGVSSDDAVHSTPGRSVRLVFIRHCQVGYNHIHPVLMDFPVELPQTDRQTDSETRVDTSDLLSQTEPHKHIDSLLLHHLPLPITAHRFNVGS